jgi:UDP-N-acetylglucosamine 2-epimerase (non-hydrolysing)
MKIAIVLGTRPEIIKMSPIVRELEKKGIDFFILHTGQHYSYNMDQIFFEQLELPKPRYNLKVGSGTHAEETGKMMIAIEKVLVKERPEIVLVEGDTNTVLAGALASVKIGVPVGHVEAGLRSFDESMPEEINRKVVDHISNLLFAPTEKAKGKNLKLVSKNHGKRILDSLGIKEENYFLVTIHRQENVDELRRFKNIISGLKLLQKYYNMPIIYPIHPRARKRMKEYNLDHESIILTEPLDYLSFLVLESKAKLILTDSGGVQEEACILKVPCVTLRDNTERPETLEVGANIIAGTEPKRILEKAISMIESKRNWPNPFGDGRAGERIIKIILNYYSAL